MIGPIAKFLAADKKEITRQQLCHLRDSRANSRYDFRMSKKLFLLDGMALVYRSHFALIAKPIFTSKGVNSSALYGFTQTLLEILSKQQPTHLAVAFDTDAPTPRHTVFPEYKATRQAMPE